MSINALKDNYVHLSMNSSLISSRFYFMSKATVFMLS